MRNLITSKLRGFLTATNLRTEPGRSRLNLLLCALTVAGLCCLDTWAHTERHVLVAIQQDQEDLTRQAKSAALTTVGYMAQIGGW